MSGLDDIPVRVGPGPQSRPRCPLLRGGGGIHPGRGRQVPDPPPLLWLDEWNVNAGEDPAMSGSYGAAFAAAVLDSAQSAGIDRATFYEAADDSALDNFGVLTQTLAPKFDYQAFAMWHSMAGAELSTAIAPNQTSADPQGRIGAVASTSAGVISVLVYNFDPTGPAGSAGQPVPASLSHTVILRVTGLPGGQHYSVNRTLVDPSDNPSSPQSLGTVVAGGTLQFTQTGQSVFSADVGSDELSSLQPPNSRSGSTRTRIRPPMASSQRECVP